MYKHRYRIGEVLKVINTKYSVIVLGHVAASSYYVIGYIGKDNNHEVPWEDFLTFSHVCNFTCNKDTFYLYTLKNIDTAPQYRLVYSITPFLEKIQNLYR